MPGYGMGYYRFFDPTMILVLIGVVLSMAASAKVQSTFAKYSRIRVLFCADIRLKRGKVRVV